MLRHIHKKALSHQLQWDRLNKNKALSRSETKRKAFSQINWWIMHSKIHLYKISWNCKPFQYSQIQKVKSLGCEKPCSQLSLGLPSKYMSTERKTLPFTEKLARNKVPVVFTPLWTSSKSVFHRTTPERMEGLAVTNTTDFQRWSCKLFYEVPGSLDSSASTYICSCLFL